MLTTHRTGARVRRRISADSSSAASGVAKASTTSTPSLPITKPAFPSEARSPGFATAAYAPSESVTSVKCEGPGAGGGVTGRAPTVATMTSPPVSSMLQNFVTALDFSPHSSRTLRPSRGSFPPDTRPDEKSLAGTSCTEAPLEPGEIDLSSFNDFQVLRLGVRELSGLDVNDFRPSTFDFPAIPE